ncbi:MAG: conjugal transfer protein TrbE, partial [Campylobacterales bacterium]|nr:conjugal transfer protein TrbE [Campylobacterales bacterium]
MLNLKMYRTKLKGLPHLLNYAATIAPGLYLNKDGSLTASYRFKASDVFSSTPDERNNKARILNGVLSKFGGGWVMHIDAIRLPIDEYPKESECHFNDEISHLIDRERRELFLSQNNLFETNNIITLTYMPPIKSKQKATDMMFDDDTAQKSDSTKASKIIKEFEAKISEFESLSSNVFDKIERLGVREWVDEYGNTHYDDEFLQFVNFCIVGRNHPVQLPNIGMYLDTYIGGYDFWTGVIPKVDDKYIGVVAIDGFPQQSFPNVLDKLSQFPMQYRWNSRFQFLDNYEAIQITSKQQSKWKQKEKGILAQIFNPHTTNIDEHAVAMVNEVKDAKSEINSGLLKYGYYTTNIVILNEDRELLEHQLREVRKVIEAEGFNARIETVNAVEAWLGTLPAHSVQNVRNFMISTFHLSHFFPLSSIWAGDKHNQSNLYPPKSPALAYTITNGNTPFRLNLHVEDVGHTLIFGPTGSGKSTLLSFLITQHKRYAGARIYAFDKGMSMFPVAKAMGGEHYEIAGDSSRLAFAPLSNLKNKSDEAWAEGWIVSMLELQNIKPTPKQKEMIHEAMLLHRDQNSTSLTEFISNLQDETMRTALSHYSLSGSMGHLLDAESDSLSLSDFTVFEIEELMNLRNEDAVPVLLYLFHKIEKSLDGRPTMLILDEAWLMLGHPVFRDKIREWLKVFRKANCSVILATQSLSDASNSGILDVLQEACHTKIILPNPQAFNKGSENSFGPYDFYKQFGLNDREIEIIATALQKREYYYTSPYGTRLFNLALGPIALAFVAASSKTDIKKIKS